MLLTGLIVQSTKYTINSLPAQVVQSTKYTINSLPAQVLPCLPVCMTPDYNKVLTGMTVSLNKCIFHPLSLFLCGTNLTCFLLVISVKINVLKLIECWWCFNYAYLLCKRFWQHIRYFSMPFAKLLGLICFIIYNFSFQYFLIFVYIA
jgi:hypothetical protein